jgi:uncharacterized membrane protein YfcA
MNALAKLLLVFGATIVLGYGVIAIEGKWHSQDYMLVAFYFMMLALYINLLFGSGNDKAIKKDPEDKSGPDAINV